MTENPMQDYPEGFCIDRFRARDYPAGYIDISDLIERDNTDYERAHPGEGTITILEH